MNNFKDIIITNDEYSELDMLDRGVYIDSLNKIIIEAETPFSIGIYGSWGSGKTTLMKKLSHVLGEDTNTKYLIVWHEPILYQDYKYPFLSLFHTILNSLEDKNTIDKLKSKFLKVFSTTFNLIINTISDKVDLPNLNEIKSIKELYEFDSFLSIEYADKLKKEIQDTIKKILKDKYERIIIFIDDLDRCKQSEVIIFFDIVKYYLNIKGCIYIYGFDQILISDILNSNSRTPNSMMNDPLSKIIQFPLTIPLPSKEVFNDYLNEFIPLKYKQFLDIIACSVNYNPRHAKRFSNILNFCTIKTETKYGDKYNHRSLLLYVIIQYRYPNLHNLLAKYPNKLIELSEFKELSDEYIQLVDKHFIEILRSFANNDIIELNHYISHEVDLSIK